MWYKLHGDWIVSDSPFQNTDKVWMYCNLWENNFFGFNFCVCYFSGSLRVLHRILAVPSIALFSPEMSDVVPGIIHPVWGWLSQYPDHQWHHYCLYPPHFYEFFLPSLVILQVFMFLFDVDVFWCLSTTTTSDWLAITRLSVGSGSPTVSSPGCSQLSLEVYTI